MNLKEYFSSLAAYNAWSQVKIKEYIHAISEEQANQVQVSSFKTIRDTLMHIWGAQSIWLDRVNGVNPIQWPGQNFTGSTASAADLLVDNCTAWKDLINGLAEADFDKSITYKSLSGEEFSSTVAQIFPHVMNHSTYHRGQLITMLRGAGYTDVGSTDMISYFREHS